MMTEIFSAVVLITVIGVAGAAILVIASRYLQAKQDDDERAKEIKQILPGVNCGACGHSSCGAYAEAITKGDELNRCVPGGAETAQQLAVYMGVEVGTVQRRKAIVACQGTMDNRTTDHHYAGVSTCAANTQLYSGDSTCPYGCMGYGDCVKVCQYDAIHTKNGLAEVDLEKCTGCGACLKACPKKIIWIREINQIPVVMCANHQRGLLTKKACTAGCIGCMKCEKICPTTAIRVTGNVARIDMALCSACGKCVEVCPVGAIVTPA